MMANGIKRTILLFFLAVAIEIGGTSAQSSLTCINRPSPCFRKKVRCPKECPVAKPSNPKAKGCFLDCNSPKCETVCRGMTTCLTVSHHSSFLCQPLPKLELEPIQWKLVAMESSCLFIPSSSSSSSFIVHLEILLESTVHIFLSKLQVEKPTATDSDLAAMILASLVVMAVCSTSMGGKMSTSV